MQQRKPQLLLLRALVQRFLILMPAVAVPWPLALALILPDK